MYVHICTFVDAYCDTYIGFPYWYRQYYVCAWVPSCIYTHTHSSLWGEGGPQLYLYIYFGAVFALSEARIFWCHHSGLQKGYLICICIYICTFFVFVPKCAEMNRDEPRRTEMNREWTEMNRDEPRYCQISLLRGKSDNPEWTEMNRDEPRWTEMNRDEQR